MEQNTKVKQLKQPLTIICLVSSLVGLILIYIAAANIQPKQLQISDISFELVGRSVATTGYVSSVSKHPDGHIFLTLSDKSASVQVPLFASFVNAMKAEGINPNFRKGDVLEVEGLAGEYRGQLQIIPRKTSDIKILENDRDVNRNGNRDNYVS